MGSKQQAFLLHFDKVKSLEMLEDSEKARFVDFLISHAKGDPMPLTGALGALFKEFENQFVRDKKKYDERCERNAKNAKKRWDAIASENMRSHQVASSRNAKNANTDTDTDTDTDTKTKECKEVIDYLNQKAGRKFKAVKSSTRELKARLSEGFTVDDCKKVIDNMISHWAGDDKMEQYLRPQTLFNGKFDGYLNAGKKTNTQPTPQPKASFSIKNTSTPIKTNLVRPTKAELLAGIEQNS